MTTEIIFPEMGEGVIEGTLTRWLVQEGQAVQQYDPIAELETDKVTTEISTEVAGTILKLCVNEGDTVPVETVLATVGSAGDDPAASNGDDSAASSSEHGRPTPATESSPSDQQKQPYSGRVSPVVGRIAAEHQVDLTLVKGTGRDGRVTKQDILAYVEQRDTVTEPAGSKEAVPQPALVLEEVETRDESKAPVVALDVGDKMLPMTGMRRAIADHMVSSKRTSPHVTTVFEFDFTAVAAHRTANKAAFAQDRAKLTFTVYIVAAIVQALKQHPLANSVWTDDGVILRREINIGMAAAVPGGLVVPVIRQADSMNLLGLARAINDLTHRARNKQLTPQELQGGTFSLTNHGTSGSLFATPIINQPQAGILGIGKIEKRVKVINDAIAIRPLAFASFTFDHRILDGATADAFVSTIKEIIEDWQ
jgi:2-oxoglutarate dehydrogenase E2 component (dihydrolipoamide succinyltransferase)